MVKAVIFDFDGTLVDFINTDVECLKLILKETGAQVEPDSFVDRAVFHIISFHELVDSGKANTHSLHHYRLSNSFSDFGLSWDEDFVDRYKQILLERTTPYPGVPNLLSYLQGKAKLGILTNAYDPILQTKRIQASGLADFFDRIQISGEEIYAKPDPDAFHLICNRLRIRPEECIFVGDSLKYDIEGALAAGMQTILVQREEYLLKNDSNSRVTSVMELRQILRGMIEIE